MIASCCLMHFTLLVYFCKLSEVDFPTEKRSELSSHCLIGLHDVCLIIRVGNACNFMVLCVQKVILFLYYYCKV